MGDIMTTTFIRKIMKGKKIMQKETKKEKDLTEFQRQEKLKYLTEFACLKTAQTNQITNTQMMK